MTDINARIAQLSPEKRALLEARLQATQLPLQPAQQQRIPRVSPRSPLPLSAAQQRMWLIEQMEPGNLAYHRPVHFRLTGELNIKALILGLNEIIRRHDSLRTTFPIHQGHPIQSVREPFSLPLPVYDLSAPSKDDHASALQQIEAWEQAPFSLAEGPLIRARLLKLEARSHVLRINLHHIVFDGWSVGILQRELSALYAAFLAGEASPLLEITVQYADYAHWQQENEVNFEASLGYWRSQLAGELPVLELPTSKPRPQALSAQGARHTLLLPKPLSADLKRLAQQEESTLFMVLLLAFQTLLCRYTGQLDVVIGTPISGRDRIETEPLIGLFVNTLALRTSWSEGATFRALLRQVKTTVLNAYEHQSLPFEKIVEAIKPERISGQSPIFQVMFQLRNLPKSLQDQGQDQGLRVEEMPTAQMFTAFDLNLDIVESDEGLVCHFLYRDELFDAEAITRLAGHFQTLLEGVVADPLQRVSYLPLLTAVEKQQILTEWNSPSSICPSDRCVHQLFEAQVRRSPDAVAAVFEGEQLTYRTLNERANQLARYLRKLDVVPETRVGLYLGRSLKTIVAILAVLKAGGAYVPLDASSPESRWQFIIADAGMNLLLTETKLLPNISSITENSAIKTVDLDAEGPLISQNSVEDLYCTITPQNLIYLTYTPGITGCLKGVLVQHSNVTRLLEAEKQQFQFTEQDTWALIHSYASDVSVWDIWGSLLHGGRLVVVPEMTTCSPDLLCDLLQSEEITVLSQTPAAFNQLMKAAETMPEPLKLRQVILSGGTLDVRRLRPWFERYGDCLPQISKMYGTTEATVFATHYAVSLADLSDDAVGGRIIGRPILGTQLYVLDGQQQLLPVGVPGELYIGGNSLARGYHNRPKLTAEKFVASPFCSPTKKGSPELISDEKRLYRTGDVGYFLPNGDIRYLGRIDTQVKKVSLSPTKAETALPITEIEKQLSDIWCDILQLAQVGVHDNFFEVGGHSLLATQVVVRSRKAFNAQLAVRSIFDSPTIAALASFISQQKTADALTNIPKISRSHLLPLSFAQQRLWFVDQFQANSRVAYNIPMALRLSGPLNVTALERVIAEIACRHEALRANFKMVEGTPLQTIRSAEPIRLPVVDLQSSQENRIASDLESHLSQQMCRVLQAPFDLSCDLLLRAELLRLEPDMHMLLVSMHHIVSDGWSIGVFTQELSTLYRDFSQQRPPSLPPLPIQYADFAHWQRQQQDAIAPHLEYWLNQLKNIPQRLELPTDYPRPLVQTFQGRRIHFQLSAELSWQLNGLARSSETTLFITLLAAFSSLLYRYSNAEDIVIGSPIANRSRSELEPLIGFFVNTLLLRANLAGEPTFSGLLAQLKQTALEAYNHQDLPLEKIVEAINPERNLSYNPLFQVMFVLQNAASEPLSLPDITVTPVAVEGTTSKVDLTLSMHETPEGLAGSWEYNSDLFSPETVQRMVGHFETMLAGIVADPLQPVSKLPLLTPREKQQIFEWNSTSQDYPRDLCLHQLFEAQVKRSPDAIAITSGNEQLTYQTVNNQANHLAHQLRPKLKNAGSEVFVGICVEDPLKMIVSMLAVLKAGGAYVPLDVAYPEERLSFIIKDAQLAALVTQAHLKPKLEKSMPAEIEVVCFSDDWKETIAENNDTDLSKRRLTSASAAYLIYTSGSTGKPKGVQVPHHAVSRLVLNTNYVQIAPNSRMAQISSTSFDAATFEIWGALLNGAQLVCLPKAVVLDPDDFAGYLKRAEIDTLFLTTALFNQIALFVPEAFKSLKTVLFGGEAISLSPVMQVLQSGKPQRLLHVYGPTENTTFSTFYEITDIPSQATTLPIGRPIANSTAYVLDSRDQPVPIGIPGELCVGGEGLAIGYLDRAELTADRFVERSLLGASSVRLYKTGDLVRRLADGEIEFIGRKDFQVKIRGFRVELGEVESALLKILEVEAAVAIAQKDASGNQALTAYLVPQLAATLSAAQIRRELQQRLPSFMIPAAIRIVPKLPLTPNGKVDRRALIQDYAISDRSTPTSHKDPDEPRNETEQQLIQVWESCLNVRPIGIHDNFFDLGGHSLVAMKVIFTIEQQTGLTFSINQLFKTPTIAGLSQVLVSKRADSLSADAKQTDVLPSCLVEMKSGGSAPPLFLIHAGGPSILFYRPLVESLTVDRRIYGIQSALLADVADLANSAFKSVEMLAAFYISQVKEVQPQGPYLLGGASFGGLVAYEMARQLVASGDRVAALIILDRPIPGGRSLMPLTQRYQKYWRKFLETGPAYLLGKIQGRAIFEKDKLWRRFSKAQQRYRAMKVSREPMIASYRELSEYHTRLAKGYEAKPYAGKVIVVRAETVAEGFVVHEEDLGWSRYAQGGVDVISNPGGHMTMFRPPHVETLAAQIETLLRSCSN